MVNTFLVVKPPFRYSAKYLDNKRCFKQILEARQILNILEDLHAIVKIFNWKQFEVYNHDDIQKEIHSFKRNGDLVKEIRKRYLANDKRLVLKTDGIYNVVDLSYEIQEDDIRIVKLGFSQHAVVRMWIGYEESLKSYINDHIDEWCSRKNSSGGNFKCSIEKYKTTKNIDYPWWTSCLGFLKSHRAALLAKEIARKELPRYVKFDVFHVSEFYKKRGYIWTNNLTIEQIESLINGSVKSSFFAPINERAVNGK